MLSSYLVIFRMLTKEYINCSRLCICTNAWQNDILEYRPPINHVVDIYMTRTRWKTREFSKLYPSYCLSKFYSVSQDLAGSCSTGPFEHEGVSLSFLQLRNDWTSELELGHAQSEHAECSSVARARAEPVNLASNFWLSYNTRLCLAFFHVLDEICRWNQSCGVTVRLKKIKG